MVLLPAQDLRSTRFLLDFGGAANVGRSVDPLDGNPLRLGAERVQRVEELVEREVKVFVDDDDVNVFVVGTLEPGALLHRAPQVLVLDEGRERLHGAGAAARVPQRAVHLCKSKAN